MYEVEFNHDPAQVYCPKVEREESDKMAIPYCKGVVGVTIYGPRVKYGA